MPVTWDRRGPTTVPMSPRGPPTQRWHADVLGVRTRVGVFVGVVLTTLITGLCAFALSERCLDAPRGASARLARKLLRGLAARGAGEDIYRAMPNTVVSHKLGLADMGLEIRTQRVLKFPDYHPHFGTLFGKLPLIPMRRPFSNTLHYLRFQADLEAMRSIEETEWAIDFALWWKRCVPPRIDTVTTWKGSIWPPKWRCPSGCHTTMPSTLCSLGSRPCRRRRTRQWAPLAATSLRRARSQMASRRCTTHSRRRRGSARPGASGAIATFASSWHSCRGLRWLLFGDARSSRR